MTIVDSIPQATPLAPQTEPEAPQVEPEKPVVTKKKAGKKVKKQRGYKIYLYPHKNLHLNTIPDLNIPRRDCRLTELHISHSLPLFEGSLKGLSEEVSSLKAWSGHQT